MWMTMRASNQNAGCNTSGSPVNNSKIPKQHGAVKFSNPKKSNTGTNSMANAMKAKT
jgi:hypothetical protein